MDTLRKVLDYLDGERKDFRAFISRQTVAPSISSRDDERVLIEMSRKATLDRGMGVVMFAQSLGVSYEDTKEPYEEFKTIINELADYGKECIK